MLGFLFGIDKNVTIFAAFKLYISVGECVCQGCRHFLCLKVRCTILYGYLTPCCCLMAQLLPIWKFEQWDMGGHFLLLPYNNALNVQIWRKKLSTS